MKKRDLRDRVIVITGASSGIGAATALACARAGMDVVLTARRAERLEAVGAQIEQAGRRAVRVPADVTEPGLPRRLVETAESSFGRLDAVFANAGYGLNRTVLETSDDEWRRMFDVNFFAGLDLLRVAALHLRERKRPGHLLMCASCLSKFSLPDHAAYSATKAAQDAVCRSMRLEHASDGIYVSCVQPITTTTEFFEVSARLSGTAPPPGGTPAHSPGFFTQPPERVARAVVRCLRRPRPEVWTSTIVRTVAGVITIAPRLGDLILRGRD